MTERTKRELAHDAYLQIYDKAWAEYSKTPSDDAFSKARQLTIKAHTAFRDAYPVRDPIAEGRQHRAARVAAEYAGQLQINN